MIRGASLFLLMAGSGHAGVFDLPSGATEVSNGELSQGSYALPLAPFFEGELDTLRVEGHVTRQIWQFSSGTSDAFALISPFRQALIDQGFNVLLDCAARACGGFDFRFATDVAAPPEMFVDIGDFHFISAKRIVDAEDEYVSLLGSTSAEKGFLQVTRVGPKDLSTQAIATSSKTPLIDSGPLINRLQDNGFAVLEDLSFPTGSSSLSEDEFPSLGVLADYLKANPKQMVTLVGHTDAEGSLAGNIALSRKRATSVVDRLVTTYGVDPEQIGADGVGFLSPRASNNDDAGRRKNRRVEVILTATR